MSHYGDLDYLDYESESAWEARRENERAAVKAIQLPRWIAAEGVPPREQINQYFDIVKPVFEAAGWVILGDGYNETGEGFPYFVENSYDWGYHRNAILQAPNNIAMIVVLKLSASKCAESQSFNPINTSLSLIGQLNGPCHRDLLCPMPVGGFYNCNFSMQRSNRFKRGCFNIHMEDCVHEGIPAPDQLLETLQKAIDDLADPGFAQAPFEGSTFLGNNVDNSYVFSVNHSTSGSHELFWERAGKDKILKVVPEGCFTTRR